MAALCHNVIKLFSLCLFRATGFFNEADTLESSSILISLFPEARYLYTRGWLKVILIKRVNLRLLILGLTPNLLLVLF